MSKLTTLTGLTWDHPRAWTRLFAETERYNLNQTDVVLSWEKHSLRGFEATPIAESAKKYDLIVLDHPFVGEAAEGGALVNLLDYPDIFNFPNLVESYIGPSYTSYAYGCGVWALPIDGACQTSVARPDLMGRQLPETFDDVLAFGKQGGLGLSMAAPHAFMNFLAIAGRQDADLSGVEESLLPHEVAISALHIHRQMAQLIPEEAFAWSSIDLLEAMATTDDIKYCPMVFCFNSYAQRPRDGSHLLRFSSLPGMTAGQDSGVAVAGGTGLAVSSDSIQRKRLCVSQRIGWVKKHRFEWDRMVVSPHIDPSGRKEPRPPSTVHFSMNAARTWKQPCYAPATPATWRCKIARETCLSRMPCCRIDLQRP